MRNNPNSNPYNTPRNELLQGNNSGGGGGGGARTGGGRAWGAQPKETAQTENLDNRQLLDLQKQTMNEQDQVLDILADSIGRQKEIALSIGKEVDEHILLLDDLDSKVDRTDGRLRAASKKVTQVAKESSTGIMWSVICILVLVLIVVSILAIKM